MGLLRSAAGGREGVQAAYARLGGAAWGHSVAELLAGLSERIEVPTEIRDAARRLDRFSVQARYPNGWETGSPHRPAFDGIGLPVEVFCYTREEAERVPLARRALAGGVLLAGRS